MKSVKRRGSPQDEIVVFRLKGMRRRLSVERLTKRIRKLIPETGCCILKRAICDFERTSSGIGGQARVITDKDRVLQGG